MIMVYQSSDPRNDFYLLHAVTSSFALCKVLSLFDKEHKYFKLEALRVHLCNLFALYLAQKSPALREENLVKTKSSVSLFVALTHSLKGCSSAESGHGKLRAGAKQVHGEQHCLQKTFA